MSKSVKRKAVNPENQFIMQYFWLSCGQFGINYGGHKQIDAGAPSFPAHVYRNDDAACRMVRHVLSNIPFIFSFLFKFDKVMNVSRGN